MRHFTKIHFLFTSKDVIIPVAVSIGSQGLLAVKSVKNPKPPVDESLHRSERFMKYQEKSLLVDLRTCVE
jgi:hypothetical protein